jgi:hypothetical protein
MNEATQNKFLKYFNDYPLLDSNFLLTNCITTITACCVTHL